VFNRGSNYRARDWYLYLTKVDYRRLNFLLFLQVVWFLTCFGVILLGVDVGLGVGVICALFAVVLTLSR